MPDLSIWTSGKTDLNHHYYKYSPDGLPHNMYSMNCERFLTGIMRHVIFSVCAFILICFPGSTCKAFTFDWWESGMSLKKVIEVAQRENIAVYKSGAALSQKGFDPIVRPFLNKELNPKYLEDIRQIYYGENIFKKWATITLAFTPTSKRLSSIYLKWTEYSIDGLKSRQFDQDFLNAVKKTLEKKYGSAIEIETTDQENTLFKTYSCYWEIGGADIIWLNSDYKSLRLVYNNSTIVELAEKETAIIEKKKSVEEKEKEVEDMRKF